jgi:glycosyltransferase involved in cell wall biosynthesis
VRRFLRRPYRKVRRFLRRPYRKVRRFLRRPYRKVRRFLRRRSYPHSLSFEAAFYRWHGHGSREVISLLSSNGQYTYNELIDLSHAMVSGDRSAKRKFEQLNKNLLLELARILAIQPCSENDLINALELYSILEPHLRKYGSDFADKPIQGIQGIQFTHQQIILGLLNTLNRPEDWRKYFGLFEDQLHRFNEVDALHFKLSKNYDESSWLAALNREFEEHGLLPISLSGASDSLFDSLTSEPQDFHIEGPLVTIIVTTFNSGIELLTCISSLVNQTWQNIEIVIVDDASTDTDVIKNVIKLDPRIKFFALTKNSGTYVARNFGIAKSRGSLITFLDSDDWAHPQRIEHQAGHLIESSHMIANLTKGLRVDQSLILNPLGFYPERTNLSSLMINRSVTDEIGVFDSSRKAADSEFIERINTCYPGQLQTLQNGPLSIIRIRENSLSNSEIKPLWTHPVRRSYRNSFQHSHEGIQSKNGVGADYISQVLFTPYRYLPNFDKDLAIRFDVIYAANFATKQPKLLNSLISEIDSLTNMGVTVAIMQLYPQKNREGIFEYFQDLLNKGVIGRVELDDKAVCSVVVVRTLKPLQIRSPLAFNITFDKVYAAPFESFTNVNPWTKRFSSEIIKGLLFEIPNQYNHDLIKQNSVIPLHDATWFLSIDEMTRMKKKLQPASFYPRSLLPEKILSELNKLV